MKIDRAKYDELVASMVRVYSREPGEMLKKPGYYACAALDTLGIEVEEPPEEPTILDQYWRYKDVPDYANGVVYDSEDKLVKFDQYKREIAGLPDLLRVCVERMGDGSHSFVCNKPIVDALKKMGIDVKDAD